MLGGIARDCTGPGVGLDDPCGSFQLRTVHDSVTDVGAAAWMAMPSRSLVSPQSLLQEGNCGATTEDAGGGGWGGHGQHGGPFSSTQGAPILISFCKASFKLFRCPVSEQNNFLFDFVNQSR